MPSNFDDTPPTNYPTSVPYIQTTDAVQGDSADATPPLTGKINVVLQAIIKRLAWIKAKVDAGVDNATIQTLINNALKPAWTSVGLQNAGYNTSFSLDLWDNLTGLPKITFSATGLPTGISINTKTGVISGKTTVSGTHAITVTATNAKGSTNITFNLQVAQIAIPVWTETIPILNTPINISQYVTSSSPVIFSKVSGAVSIQVNSNGDVTLSTKDANYLATIRATNNDGYADKLLTFT